MALSILMFNGSFRVNSETVFIDVDVTVSVPEFHIRKRRY